MTELSVYSNFFRSSHLFHLFTINPLDTVGSGAPLLADSTSLFNWKSHFPLFARQHASSRPYLLWLYLCKIGSTSPLACLRGLFYLSTNRKDNHLYSEKLSKCGQFISPQVPVSQSCPRHHQEKPCIPLMHKKPLFCPSGCTRRKKSSPFQNQWQLSISFLVFNSRDFEHDPSNVTAGNLLPSAHHVLFALVQPVSMSMSCACIMMEA